MKKLKYVLPLIFVLCYIVFTGRDILPEVSLVPRWTRSVDREVRAPADKFVHSIPFTFSGRFGYFLPDGTILASEKTLYDVAIDEKGFVNYSSVNNSLLVRSPDGTIEGSVLFPGYPFFLNGRRFVISPDENTLAEINTDGDVLWHSTFSSLVTGISVKDGYVFVGTLNDGAVLLGEKGKRIYTFVPDVSRINIIYGVSVSRRGKRLLVVSGIDPQIITILEKKGNTYKSDYSLELASPLRHHVLCGFSEGGKYALIERSKSVMLLNIQKKDIMTIRQEGMLQTYHLRTIHEPLFIVSETTGRNIFSSFTGKGTKIFSFSLSGGIPYFHVDSSSLYIGLGERLVKLDMVEQ